MPINPSAPPQKKKKGPAPAHQNKYAWTHNPKSKTTAKILASPNIHVCRRCHDKIEWRKQYRKYKPLTQPSTCNGCKKRNVKASYHTICEACTRTSEKAKEIIAAATSPGDEPSADPNEGDGEEQEEETWTSILRGSAPKPRACAVCVKELALPDPEEDDDNENVLDRLGRMKLRERKAIERQLEREAREARNKSKEGDAEEKQDNDDDSHKKRPDVVDDDSAGDLYSDDEDDPFLKAVGGADKLLTGKAYQDKLLAQLAQR
jgi:Uncharacterized conserved protein (DUF2039)